MLLPALSLFACTKLLAEPVLEVHAYEGDTLLYTAESEGQEFTFTEDLPVTVSFEVVFDQPMDQTSLEQSITLEDADGAQAGLIITQRLEVTTIQPEQSLAPALNHALTLPEEVESTTGDTLGRTYAVNFYTAPAQ